MRTTIKIIIVLLTLFMISSTFSESVSSKDSAYTYTSFEGTSLSLYPYVGRHIALLVDSPNLDEKTLTTLVDVMDKAYEYYHEITGREPEPSSHYKYQNRSTVAVVPKTCGYACGYPGSNGIELSSDAFKDLYEGVLSDNLFNQAIFYEFGRNFWFYGDKLEYKDPDDSNSTITGYAVFMRFMAIEKLGINAAPFHDQDFDYFKSEVKKLTDRYLSDPSLNWSNTLKTGNAPSNPMDLGSTDLFASFLFKLNDLFGDEFLTHLWKEVDKRPYSNTTQDAVDNFILAASAASEKNLTSLFEDHWRWPVSGKAKAEALKLFGPPYIIEEKT